jgi:hypothetical protein
MPNTLNRKSEEEGAAATGVCERLCHWVELFSRRLDEHTLRCDWGQGLWEKDKFSSLVEDEVERRYGISAECVARYAQSGASLGGKSNAADAERTDDGDYSGEVPLGCNSDPIDHSQTIYSQLYTLADDFDPLSIDLLLVDGGINSGDLFWKILTPTTSVDDLRTKTQEVCHEDMAEFLGTAAGIFGKAHIVVTGYYPIFSALSDLTLVGVFVAGVLAARGHSLIEISAALGSAETFAKEAFTNLVILSTVWGEESANALRQAVDEIGSSRITYAHVEFGAKNCLFVPLTSWLWGFGSLPSLPWSGSFGLDELFGWVLTLLGFGWLRLVPPADPVRNEREKFCKTFDFECNWASVGHPCKTGAEKYCDTIMQALEDTGFDPSPKKWVEPIVYLSMSSPLGTHGSAALPAILHPLDPEP